MGQFKVTSKVSSFRFKNQRYHPGDIVEISEEDAAKINGNFLLSVSDLSKEEISEKQVTQSVASLGPEAQPVEIEIVTSGEIVNSVISKVGQGAEASKDIDLPVMKEPPVIDDWKKKKPKVKTFQVEQ